jgi:hypothetical protein
MFNYRQLKSDQPISTIVEIRTFKFAGNHMSDSGRFDAIDRFVQSDAPMPEKIEALEHMSRDGMGIAGPVTEQDVKDYLFNC